MILTSISNYINHKVSDEITYPFLKLNGEAFEGWGMDEYFHPTTYWACMWLLIHVDKMDRRNPQITFYIIVHFISDHVLYDSKYCIP